MYALEGINKYDGKISTRINRPPVGDSLPQPVIEGAGVVEQRVVAGGAVQVDEGGAEGGQVARLPVVGDGGQVDEVGADDGVPHLMINA